MKTVVLARRYFFIGLILIVCPQGIIAQKPIFEINLGVKLWNMDMYKTDGEILNAANVSYSFQNFNHSKSNIPEPEININCYQLNDKWKFGFGSSVYNWSSINQIQSMGNSLAASLLLYGQDTNIVYTEVFMRQNKVRNTQFYLTATRYFSISPKIDRYVKNQLSGGIGIRKTSRNDLQSTLNKNLSLIDGNNYYITTKKAESHAVFGYLTPILFLKYELSCFNKRNSLGMFQFSISYTHGLTQIVNYSIENQNDSGARLTVYSNNRGSGFRVGISKTIGIRKKIEIPL
jgi:hypothetical protein